MQQGRMVRLITVRNTFHARVIAARLGADGIVTELRGNVDGPYPIGEVSVYVATEDADAARELLLADEVEDAFQGGGEAVDHTGRATPARWVLVAVIVLVAALAVSRLV